jgi:hypothetical protein
MEGTTIGPGTTVKTAITKNVDSMASSKAARIRRADAKGVPVRRKEFGLPQALREVKLPSIRTSPEIHPRTGSLMGLCLNHDQVRVER